ncbi:hypothetical protein [Spirosoma validum]|uniref:Uncharacterized protein n=1 Tax=Spirosoma validum TaxID=2771355 RepID=A0A927B879_9BACT|nr:hypothetical protein [Spirosoma validum]MBD2756992.1 hypothetical protein [Spirosoma validum]
MLTTELVAQPQADPVALFINLPLLVLFIGLALYGFFRPTALTAEPDETDLVAIDDQPLTFAEPNYAV